MKKKEWHVIGKGQSGWHATGICVSSSSYNAGTDQLEEYAESAVEGALVYDASGPGVDLGAFVKHVVSGPMCNPELAPFAAKGFSLEDKRTVAQMLPGLQGGFKTLAIAALVERPRAYGSLDYVGVGIYEGLLREVRGIRIGKVHNGKVEWE